MDRDGMESSGNIDSMRVNGVQLAREAGQHKKPNVEMKKNIPVLSRPPTKPADHPYCYGPART